MDWGEVISISRVVEGMVGGGLIQEECINWRVCRNRETANVNLFTKEKGNKREQRSGHRVRMGTQ